MTADPNDLVDELLDRYITAWHAGEAPTAANYVAQAPDDQQEELGALIAGFLELAPTVPPSADAVAAKATDPLAQRIAALESDRWDAEAAKPWGARLRALREAAGMSLTQLASDFSQRFGLAPADAGRAPTVFEELEAGALPADGVTARAARALEEILGSVRGALDGGGAAMGGALMRSDQDSAADRQQLGDLLHQLDDALPPAGADAPESLSDLLGA